MKRIVITEAQFREIVESENRFPGYFRPKVSNGCVRLYHGLSCDSLDYVLSEDAFIARKCSEGVNGLWFSTESSGDYPSGYKCLVSIDVPVEEIGSGYSKPFNIMNSTHVFSENDVPLEKYNFKILKIGGVKLDDEMLEHWKMMSDGENGTKFLNILHDDICDGYDSLYYYVLNLIS